MKANTGLFLLAALVAAPGAARADKHTDAVKSASASLGGFASFLGIDSWDPAWMTRDDLKPAECTAILAKAKKAGITDSDVLTGGFRDHPKARQSDEGVSFFEIEFKDAPWICEEYTKQYTLQVALVPLREAADLLANATNPPTPASAKNYNAGAGSGAADRGHACLKAVDAVIAGGVAASTQVTIREAKISLADAKQTYCQSEIDYGVALEALITEAQAAKHDEIAKKYTDLGVAGARLELFIEYDDVYWRGKNCEVVDDLHAVVKAKKLFQWLENSDGTHTIRTYTFKGNTFKVKDKTYKTEAKAYKGCK